MRNKVMVVFLCLFSVHLPVFAADTEPSDVSIRELLEVTQKRKQVDSKLSMFDSLIKISLRHAIGNEALDKEQQSILNDMNVKMVALFQEEMSWDFIEQSEIEVYKKSFTQQEINGMLDFYKSPAGQAVIAKMPLV